MTHMTMHHGPGASEGPVTVIVTRRARKGRIKEFEEWMDGISHEAMKFEGHMGANIIRPVDTDNPEYVIIFRFDTYENLARWEKSAARAKWLEKSRAVTEGEARVEKQTGLEFWFTPASGTPMQPPRYKMVIVITSIISFMSLAFIPQVRQLTSDLPLVMSTILGVAVMVLLMTYVIMPTVTKLLRPWLSKKELF